MRTNLGGITGKSNFWLVTRLILACRLRRISGLQSLNLFLQIFVFRFPGLTVNIDRGSRGILLTTVFL